MSQLSIKVAQLEVDYMSRKNSLNIDMAHSLGFVDDFSKVHFSTENTNISGNLSLIGNEN